MKIRIGTRASRLALVQTKMVTDKIREKFPETEIEVVHISTVGDRVQNKPVSELGGSSVFTDEIESALLNHEIDIAVHSAKDLPARTAEGLEFVSVLRRADYRDAIITKKGVKIKNSSDFVIGTGSKRRMANTRRLYPEVSFQVIRGNVDVRLEKLLHEEYDAVILAMAGIERLGFDKDTRFDFKKFDYREFITEPCQAIIAIESRTGDLVTPVLKSVNDKKTFYAFETERYILQKLNPDGTVPLGVYANVEDNHIFIALSADGQGLAVGTDNVDNRFILADRLVNSI